MKGDNNACCSMTHVLVMIKNMTKYDKHTSVVIKLGGKLSSTLEYFLQTIHNLSITNKQIKSYLLVQDRFFSAYFSTFNSETSMVVSCGFLSFGLKQI